MHPISTPLVGDHKYLTNMLSLGHNSHKSSFVQSIGDIKVYNKVGNLNICKMKFKIFFKNIYQSWTRHEIIFISLLMVKLVSTWKFV
jgi:hypothetical protein